MTETNVQTSATPRERLHTLLADRTPALATWHTLGAPLAIEIAARSGAPLCLIDGQHGAFDAANAAGACSAAQAGGAAAIVRVPVLEAGVIGRALDAGARGVVAPMVNSAKDARRLVEAAKYPPLGARSFGPYRAEHVAGIGKDVEIANAATFAIAQIETQDALEACDAIIATPGIDGILIGPNDLSLSLLGRRDIEDDQVVAAIRPLAAKAQAAGRFAWIFCNSPAYCVRVADAGWDVVTIGTDAGLLATALGGVKDNVVEPAN